MKKKLAARVGALAMVLAVAMFMILPDMVRAGGDSDIQPAASSTEAPSTGVAPPPPLTPPSTEAPSTETPSTEVPSTEAPSTEVPSTEAPPSTEMPSTEAPSTEAPAVPSTETPAPEVTTPQTPVPENPSTENPGQNNEMPNAGTEGSTEAGNGLKTPDWELNTRTVSPVERGEFIYSDVGATGKDFVIEGTTITGYNGPGGNIAIPQGITAIAPNAFYGNITITGVSFPGSLTTIGSSAFNGCSNLESVSMPGSITSVGASAFANCTGLSSAELSPSTGNVAQGEFFNCVSLTSVTVPEGISSIESDAFGSCSNLSSISLPASLSSLDLAAFASDVNLSSITVAGGNGAYSSSDGCLYTAGANQLLLCPQGKTSIAFSQGMTSIAGGAFAGCGYLSNISIPKATNTIASEAFSSSGIRSVTIPSEVNSIGSMSNWTPDIVYGYSSSVAETWANDNGYVFQPLDSSDVPKDDETESETETEDPVKGESGSNTSTVTAATSTVSEGVTANIDRVKDTTPKTGVEDYTIYLLCLAVFMFGLACMAYSKKVEYEEKNE